MGKPSRLKPASDVALANVVADMAEVLLTSHDGLVN